MELCLAAAAAFLLPLLLQCWLLPLGRKHPRLRFIRWLPLLGSAVSCPTLGHVFHHGPFRIAAEQRQVFYRLYAAVTAGLFLLSFFVRERKPPKDP